ncbi:WD40 repeat domain-containing protein [Krasilnikovia sp. MM14-A1004]|uniref:WD40 repeat domain-containing protein n=1 Tax=Krasilnikovia sp. MM14-A1004 TaxID=3373541 RepID=UPI00399C9DCB
MHDEDTWTVPTTGQRVFTDSWGEAYDDAFLLASADGAGTVVTLHLDGTVRFSDPADGRQVRAPLPVSAMYPPKDELAVLRGPGGRQLLQVDTGADEDEPEPLIWDPATGELTSDAEPDPQPRRALIPPRYADETAWVKVLAALPGGVRVVSGHNKVPDLLVWDVATGRRVGTAPLGAEAGVSALAAVPVPGGGTVLASGDYRRSTIQWSDGGTGAPTGSPVDAHPGGVNDLRPMPLPDGRTLLVSAGGDGVIRFWDPATRARTGREITTGRQGVHRIAVVGGTSRPMVLSAGNVGVQRWNALTGEPIGAPLATDGRVETALTVLTDATGRTLIAAAGSRDTDRVRLWVAETGEPAGVLSDAANGVTGIAVDLVPVATPAGDLLACSDTGAGITLWDPVTVAPVRSPLRGHVQGDPYNTLVTLLPWPGPGGTGLLSGGCDSTIRYWAPEVLLPHGAA